MREVNKRFISISPLGVEVDILFIIILPVMFLTGYLTKYFIVCTSMVAHELGHIVCGIMTGSRVYKVRVLVVGLCASMDDGSGRNQCRIPVLLCGPMVNTVFSGAGLLVYYYCMPGSGDIRFFIISNACLAIFNLLPIYPLDGGRILRYLLAGKLGVFRGYQNARRISYSISLVLIVLGAYQTYKNIYNFSLLMAGFYLFFLLKTDITEEAAFMTVKDVIYRRSRFLKKGIYPVRDLAVLPSVKLGEVIKSMDFDRFHFIHVLNENMELLAVFTEQQVIDGLMQYGADASFDTLINLKKES